MTVACVVGLALLGCTPGLAPVAPANDPSVAGAGPSDYEPPANPLETSAFEGETLDDTGHGGHTGHTEHTGQGEPADPHQAEVER